MHTWAMSRHRCITFPYFRCSVAYGILSLLNSWPLVLTMGMRGTGGEGRERKWRGGEGKEMEGRGGKGNGGEGRERKGRGGEGKERDGRGGKGRGGEGWVGGRGWSKMTMLYQIGLLDKDL